MQAVQLQQAQQAQQARQARQAEHSARAAAQRPPCLNQQDGARYHHAAHADRLQLASPEAWQRQAVPVWGLQQAAAGLRFRPPAYLKADSSACP